MALYTFTAAEVLAAATGTSRIAGEEITAGMFCYLDSDDGNKAKKASNDTQVKAAVEGMALNHAYAGQPVNLINAGTITVQDALFGREGQVLTLASPGVADIDLGKCEDVEDLADGEFATIIGWVTDDDTFTLNIEKTGLAHSTP